MTSPRRPEGRYDAPRALSRPALVAVAGVFGTGLLGVTWLAYDRLGRDEVRYGTVAYKVLDDTSVEVTFDVRKPLTTSARCRLQARDVNSVVVGSLEVVVGPADREQVITTRSFPTTRRAATAEALRCVGATPSQGRP